MFWPEPLLQNKMRWI